ITIRPAGEGCSAFPFGPQDIVLQPIVFEPGAVITYSASIAPVTEGSDLVFSDSATGNLQFEYYVEGVSALAGTDYVDPNSTSSTHWAALGSNGHVAFRTFGNSVAQTT